MKTFTELSEQLSGTEEARQKLKKAKKGDTMSFAHHKHGELSGEYHGLKRMGAHSYASVSVKGKGKFYVPLHQVQHHPKPKVNEDTQELDERYAFGHEKMLHTLGHRSAKEAQAVGSKKVGGKTGSRFGEYRVWKMSSAAHEHLKRGEDLGSLHFDREAGTIHTKPKVNEETEKDSKHTHNWYDMSTVHDKHLDKIDDTDQSTYMHSSNAPDHDSAVKRPDHHLGVHKSNKAVNNALKRYGATKVD